MLNQNGCQFSKGNFQYAYSEERILNFKLQLNVLAFPFCFQFSGTRNHLTCFSISF